MIREVGVMEGLMVVTRKEVVGKMEVAMDLVR